MFDYVDAVAFTNDQGARAQKLFAAVVLAALDDAIADDKKYGNGAEVIARWARSRDGREVLRIRAPASSYWKATTLADFDGLRWREVRPRGFNDDPVAANPRPQWVEKLRVSVRNLRTRQFVTTGTTLRIDRSPRDVEPGAPGSFVAAGEPLRRGHAYLAEAYVPRLRTALEELAGLRLRGGDIFGSRAASREAKSLGR